MAGAAVPLCPHHHIRHRIRRDETSHHNAVMDVHHRRRFGRSNRHVERKFRDAGRSFYLHAKTVLEKHGLVELSLERSCYALVLDGRIAAAAHTHVDDFLAATDGSDRARRVLEKIKTEHHMIENASASFTYRGWTSPTRTPASS